MENLIVQFPDLTEVAYMSYNNTDGIVENLNTEFAFYLNACEREGYKQAVKLGFTGVSCMNNWWPSHSGEERKMTLYWMRNPNGMLEAPPKMVERKRWSYYGDGRDGKWGPLLKNMAGSGCALKLGEPPFKASLFHRFFTLMRVPGVPTSLQKRWLVAHNYRHIDTGQLASYYVNGWTPEEYSIKKEYFYFRTNREEWRMQGEDGFR